MNQVFTNMAKSYINILCTSCILFISLQVVAEGLSLYDKVIERSISKVTSPLNEVNQDLRNLLDDVQVKKDEVNRMKEEVLTKVSSIPQKCLNKDLLYQSKIIESWDFDSCVNFTDAFNMAANIAWDAGVLTKNLTSNAELLGINMLNCPTKNAKETAKCYRENLLVLKSLVSEFKNTSIPLAEQGAAAAKKMRADFDACIGIPITSKIAIEKNLSNCSKS